MTDSWATSEWVGDEEMDAAPEQSTETVVGRTGMSTPRVARAGKRCIGGSVAFTTDAFSGTLIP